jgi:hypothetical protein
MKHAMISSEYMLTIYSYGGVEPTRSDDICNFSGRLLGYIDRKNYRNLQSALSRVRPRHVLSTRDFSLWSSTSPSFLHMSPHFDSQLS